MSQKTDETCTANGTLNFTVANTTAGATIVYSIYQLPNTTTPISVQNTTTFTGLVAGNYRVVATQSLGNLSNSQQQDVTIISQIVLLTYQLSGTNEICGNDGTITVNVTSSAAVSYEIFAGPIIKPLQPSNIFTGLVAGQYSVRVFDACGEGVVQTFVVQTTSLNVTFNQQGVQILTCTDSIRTYSLLSSPIGSEIGYPIEVEYTVFPPSGSPLFFYQNLNSSSLVQDLPLYYGQNYSYSIRVTDVCGNVYNSNLIHVLPIMHVSVGSNRVSCSDKNLQVYTNNFGIPPFTINFLSAPVGFNPLLYNPNHPNLNNSTYATYYNPSIQLPEGLYNIEITDSCGRVSSSSTYIQFDPPPTPTLNVLQRPGCNLGYGSMFFYNGQSAIYQAIITSAPTNYPNNLPYTIYDNPSGVSSISVGNLPEGNYTLQTSTHCGIIQTTNINIIGYHIISSMVNIIEHCNSFDIDLNEVTTLNTNSHVKYWLQKFDLNTNQWGHPITGYANGLAINYSNALEINNNAVNYNFNMTGQFRIMKVFFVYGEPLQCYEEIFGFTFTGQPKINDVYSFLCDNGNYDVFVDAVGIQSLIYRITQKNGLPFVIQNGNSSVFLGLPAAVYNFQVEDACGNILNSLFEVPKPFNLAITPIGFCEGEPSSLTMPNFSIFQYQWWKDNATTTILSTTNTLAFSTFNLATDAGVYHVRVRYTGNPNSCIDFVLDYTISANAFNPNAGLDGTATYCGNQGIINLFTLLQGSYDSGGSWQETTTSGTLSANLWNSATVIPGSYQFKYRVGGLCDSFDDALVNITINSIPQTPTASVDPIVCDTQNLNLFATTIPNAIYSWTGPNGFTSNEQNPIINAISSNNNGTYTVSVADNGCVSGTSSVNVSVGLLPDFILESYCENSDYKVSGTPIDASYSYNWTGPNGFSSADNPIVISNGSTGLYNLTITTSEGCSVSKSIPILTTLCYIPNVITPNDDGFDDFLNLAGFDVEKIQIFSRWGRLVYEKENYINEWHGQNNNNNLLPESTYYYFVKLRSGEEKHGWIFVIKS